MPKIKTNRSAAKRFRATGGGKVRRHKAYASHLLSGKSPKQKRRLRKPAILSKADMQRFRRLLPNG